MNDTNNMITIIGREACGKTTLVKKICNDKTFDDATTGCNYFLREVGIKKYRFWDLSGEYRFRFMIDSFVNSRTDLVLMVYRKDNVEDLRYLWEVYIDILINKKVKILLIQTHSDIDTIASFGSKLDEINGRVNGMYIKHLLIKLKSAFSIDDVIRTSLNSGGENVFSSIESVLDDTPIRERRRSWFCCY